MQNNHYYRPVNSQPSRNQPLKRKKKKDLKTILLWSGVIFGGLFIAGIIGFIGLIAFAGIGLPDAKELANSSRFLAQSTTIYDREGNELFINYGEENRKYIAYDDISPHLINATVSIEDSRYWKHPGFDMIGIMRAFVNNISHPNQIQGGSTITQQYIKHAFLNSEKSYTRKLKELILAVRLEETFDKKKILELYLNKMPFGNHAFGVEKAAQTYFGKSAKDVDIPESAIIAAILQGPTKWNPYGTRQYSHLNRELSKEEVIQRNIKSLKDLDENKDFSHGLLGKKVSLGDTGNIYIPGRTDEVLNEMEKYGYITGQEKTEALKKLETLEFKPHINDMKHEHFVYRILEQLKEKYGEEQVESGGLKVYTTLNPKLQEIAEKTLKEGTEKNAKNFNVQNGSLVAIDPNTGEVLAYVGSKDYYDEKIKGMNDMANRLVVQPGSSFKPFVYARAFMNGFNPASVVFDSPTNFEGWRPEDWDDKYPGPMSIRYALGQSRNIPAVKAYYLAGKKEPIIELATKMGIEFSTEGTMGPSLALGAKEVRVIDIVSAFGVFASTGIRHKPVMILEVKNNKDETLDKWIADKGEEVLDPQVAYLINNILSDKSVRIGESTSKNLSIPGYINAVKTGTSSSADGRPHDLWTIGYTPHLVTGVWAGNTDNTFGKIAAAADGYNAAAPIWKKFMTQALKELKKPSEEFPVPSGIKQEKISTINGKLAGPETPEGKQKIEVFAGFAVPTEIDDSYITVEVDERNNKLGNEYCPEDVMKKKTFINLQDIDPRPEWQSGVQSWLKDPKWEESRKAWLGQTDDTGKNEKNIIIGEAPTDISELCTVEKYNQRPSIIITDPDGTEIFQNGSKFTVKVSIIATHGVEKVEYYLDNELKHIVLNAPYDGSLNLPLGETSAKSYILKAKVKDKEGYINETSIKINTTITTDDTGTQPPDAPPAAPENITPQPPDISPNPLTAPPQTSPSGSENVIPKEDLPPKPI